MKLMAASDMRGSQQYQQLILFLVAACSYLAQSYWQGRTCLRSRSLVQMQFLLQGCSALEQMSPVSIYKVRQPIAQMSHPSCTVPWVINSGLKQCRYFCFQAQVGILVVALTMSMRKLPYLPMWMLSGLMRLCTMPREFKCITPQMSVLICIRTSYSFEGPNDSSMLRTEELLKFCATKQEMPAMSTLPNILTMNSLLMGQHQRSGMFLTSLTKIFNELQNATQSSSSFRFAYLGSMISYCFSSGTLFLQLLQGRLWVFLISADCGRSLTFSLAFSLPGTMVRQSMIFLVLLFE